MRLFSKKIILVYIFIPLLLIIFACEKVKIVEKHLDRRNGTEYIFNTTIDDLYKILTKEQGFMQMLVITKDHLKIAPPEISNRFKKNDNKQDLFLWSLNDYCKSRIYYNEKGIPFDYWVSFYLHLEKIDEIHTKVIITTIEPKIVIGHEFMPTPPHFVRKSKFMKVEPSTIEEYEILLEIGKLLGEKNMPCLSLP
jgi:hypothetical protein